MHSYRIYRCFRCRRQLLHEQKVKSVDMHIHQLSVQICKLPRVVAFMTMAEGGCWGGGGGVCKSQLVNGRHGQQDSILPGIVKKCITRCFNSIYTIQFTHEGSHCESSNA